jgi:protein-S-isoprenylcysteine O-methyltransferase Ste14
VIALRALISIVLLPGLVAVLIPWRILQGAAVSPLAWLGAIAIALGLGLFGWCVVLFARRGRGTLAPWDAPRRFVASGPYRVIRNPMYVAVAAVVAGEALAFASLPLAVYLLALAVAWHIFVVLYEEPSLEQTFGDGYRAYRSRVPRWLPRLPARS